MKTIVRSVLIALVVGIFGVAGVFAQTLDCPALFRAAVAAAAEKCAGLERNQACLASGSASLSPTADYADAAFAQPGDRIDAAAIDSLTQTGGAGWALTVMRLQLNQPDAAPDYNSVLMLLGNVSLQQQAADPAAPANDARVADLTAQVNEALGEDSLPSPLQAFTFTSAADQPCGSELPQGLILQSPNLTPTDGGYLPTEAWVNGWHFALGSTVLVNADADGTTAVEVLEHYAAVGGQDGEVVVLVGQGVDLPAGTPSVSNEDGTVVVVPRPTPEPEDGIFEDLLEELFGEEEVANRPPTPRADTGTVEEIIESDSEIIPYGIWKFEVYSEASRGDCAFNLWQDLIGKSEFISLDEMVHLNSDGHPTSFSLFGIDYSFTSTSGITFGGGTLSDNGRYEAFKSPMGDLVFEWLRLDVITPFYLQGRLIGNIRDNFAPRGCVHVFQFELTSCLVDVIYDETSGNGECPAEIHQAIGT